MNSRHHLSSLSACSSSSEEPLSPGWEQDTKGQGVTLNSGRSKDHKSGQKAPTLISRSSALASTKEFQLGKSWEQSRTERRCWCRHRDMAQHHPELSLHMPGNGHPSLGWRKLKFVTCHEDAGDDEMVGTTLRCFQPSQSPSLGKAGRGRLLNPRTEVVAQHQTQLGCGGWKSASKHGASRQQNEIIQIHGLEIKKQRLQGQNREIPSATPPRDWGFRAQLEWMVRETIPVCSLYRAPTAAAAGGRHVGW